MKRAIKTKMLGKKIHARITSTSNASLDRYPDNSLTKFTHHLPAPIFLSPEKKYTIKLVSIFLSHKLRGRKSRGSVEEVRVNVDQTTPSDRGRDRFKHVLARIPYPIKKPRGFTTFFVDIDNPIPIELIKQERVEDLSFFLTDQNDKQLKLASGVTTVINLVIEEMDYYDSFTITLDAGESNAIIPSNSKCDFKVHFPSPIELDGKWEVALHHVTVPRNVKIDGTFETTVKILHDNYGYKKIRIPITGQDSATSIVTQINEKMNEMNLHLYVYYVPQFNGVFIKRRPNSYAEYIEFNEPLQKLLNLSSARTTFSPTQGEEAHKLNKGPVGDNTFPPLPEHLVLYSDIVTHSLIGNAEAPVVEVLPTFALNLTSNQYAMYNVVHLTFHPVAKQSFSSIRCKLLAIDGRELELTGDKNMSFTFFFRKVNE